MRMAILSGGYDHNYKYDLTEEQLLQALHIFRDALTDPKFEFREADPSDPDDRSDAWRINNGLSDARAQHDYEWSRAPTYEKAFAFLQTVSDLNTALRKHLGPSRSFPPAAEQAAVDALAKSFQSELKASAKEEVEADALLRFVKRLDVATSAAQLALKAKSVRRRSRSRHIDNLMYQVDLILKKLGKSTSYSSSDEEKFSLSVNITVNLAVKFLPKHMRPDSWTTVMNRKIALQRWLRKGEPVEGDEPEVT